VNTFSRWNAVYPGVSWGRMTEVKAKFSDLKVAPKYRKGNMVVCAALLQVLRNSAHKEFGHIWSLSYLSSTP